MKVGIFDHVERSDRPLAIEYDERLEFVAAADEAGFYCYHVAEHHCTPLNMVPAPGVYLGAVARATKRIHLGPLVYLLPLASPLRMIKEICMLDHLSHGRLEVGVGRGVSPFELNYHKIDHAESRDIFIDAFQCISAGLADEKFSYAGKYYSYTDVPMPMRPYQKPHPPFWYGASNIVGAAWSGEHGMNFTANGPTSAAKVNIDALKAALKTRGGPAVAKPEFPGGAAVGVLRHIVVADTDEDAVRIAKPAFEYHLASLNYLRRMHGVTATGLNVRRGTTWEECVAGGVAIAGNPETVRAEIARQAAEMGVNYLLAYLFFGTLGFADAKRSLALFGREVLPKLASI
ncbi:MAG TPA: LLM class flavin-dependent oxidoreductase [Stellaceae bacterium]|nr:LLM class flavin-dependent oxidoreductase [Stellaceae bacterium]